MELVVSKVDYFTDNSVPMKLSDRYENLLILIPAMTLSHFCHISDILKSWMYIVPCLTIHVLKDAQVV